VRWDTSVWGQKCVSEEWPTFVLWWGETQESEVKRVCLKSGWPLCCGEVRHKSLRSSVCDWRVADLCVVVRSDTRVWGKVCESEKWKSFVLWWGQTQVSEVKCVSLKSERALCCGEVSIMFCFKSSMFVLPFYNKRMLCYVMLCYVMLC